MLGTLGRLALTLGVSGALVAQGIRRSSHTYGGSAASWTALALMGATPLLVCAGLWAIRQGRRHLAEVLPSLDRLQGDEPYVLFLRAFSDDDRLARVSRWLPLTYAAPRQWLFEQPRTEEEQLACAVRPFGRMVALGRPGGRLPEPGAARHFASDHDWQDQVSVALDGARLVLLAAGPGRNLRWEVEQVVARGEPARLVLLVSGGAEQYEAFREALQSLFPRGLPEHPPCSLRRRLFGGIHVHAAVRFDDDWTPHLAMLDGRYPWIGNSRRTEAVFPLVMRPVYERAGVPLRVRRGERGDGTGGAEPARPWPVVASVALFSAYLPFGIGLDVWAAAADGSLREDLQGSAIALLAVSAWFYRIWQGGAMAVQAMTLLATGVGALLLVGDFAVYALFPHFLWMGFGVARVALGLLLPAALLTSGLLLVRHDVVEWVASRN
ncbi:hypothetical protein ACFY0R_39600 [Streptomyces sp. NPDC001633]|uniref:hypothetical protein n=1 Tax=Streptomyces sp. NPDC001633 TaxID=3364595 RepID=UPI00367FB4EA